MRVAPLPLFTNVSSGIKPVAIKSRWYSSADSGFINEKGGARGVMVIVVESGHGDTSSNPG